MKETKNIINFWITEDQIKIDKLYFTLGQRIKMIFSNGKITYTLKGKSNLKFNSEEPKDSKK